jgi:micrococcal nuclease
MQRWLAGSCWFAGILSLLLGGCGWISPPHQDLGYPIDAYPIDEAEVIRVIDGDTVDLRLDGSEERVRLIGIDTPESVSRTTPDQCWGAEASQALGHLLPTGTVVRVERDTEARDRYGRLLLYVHRSSDDLFVNQWMVQEGFAEVASYPPNDTFERHFAAVRNEARRQNLGLWAHCDGPDQPLD